MSENLKWTDHINKIQCNPKHCNRNFNEKVYISLIQSILDYSSTVWDHHLLNKDIDRLESIQLRVTSMMQDLG
jgi:hypothetical protein